MGTRQRCSAKQFRPILHPHPCRVVTGRHAFYKRFPRRLPATAELPLIYLEYLWVTYVNLRLGSPRQCFTDTLKAHGLPNIAATFTTCRDALGCLNPLGLAGGGEAVAAVTAEAAQSSWGGGVRVCRRCCCCCCCCYSSSLRYFELCDSYPVVHISPLKSATAALRTPIPGLGGNQKDSWTQNPASVATCHRNFT